jgi:hypothetical protein
VYNLNDDFFQTVIKPSLVNLDLALQNYPGQTKRGVWNPPFDGDQGHITLTYQMYEPSPVDDRKMVRREELPLVKPWTENSEEQVPMPWSEFRTGSVVCAVVPPLADDVTDAV